MFDLTHIISGKIRLRLLMKFFLNPNNQVYLRGLAKEFDVSTNTVRQELEKLSDSGVIESSREKQKRLFKANVKHPLYGSIRQMLLQYTGIETIFEEVIHKIGDLNQVYLTGPLARGVDTTIVDLVVIGEVDKAYLHKLVSKAEEISGKKIRIAIYDESEWTMEHLNGMIYYKLLG